MDLEQVYKVMTGLREALGKVVVGLAEPVEHALVALLAGGHVLLEGPPGTAKTLLVRALAHALRGRFARIQFTPDLMPADITGLSIYNTRDGVFVFQAGPVFCDLLLADEINRAPAKTQSALLEAMQEGQVTVDGEPHPLSPVFTVFATQNPIEHEGTYPLPEAQLDRFMFKSLIAFPSREVEEEMLARHQAGFDSRDAACWGLEPQAGVEDLVAMRNVVRTVRAVPEVLQYISAVVRATREHHTLMLGASPRASVMLLAASRAIAVLRNRDFVIPDDVRDLAPPILRHRVVLTPEAEIEGITADACIEKGLENVPVPRL